MKTTSQIRPVDLLGFCQLAQRYGLSAHQAVSLYRAAGLHIASARFSRYWRAAKAAERSLAWSGTVRAAA